MQYRTLNLTSSVLFISLHLLVTAPAAVAQTNNLNGVITMGDSLTAGLAGNGQGGFTCAAQGNRSLTAAEQSSCKGNGAEGVGGWQPALKNLINTSVYNHGNSGELSGAILARLNAALLAQQSTHVLIMAGTNDTIFGSVTGATDNIREMIRQSKAAGRVPIVATVPPLLGSVVSSSNNQVLQLNSAIKNLAQEFEDLIVIDVYAALIDSWAQDTSGDFIHLGSSGNQKVAALWFEAIQQNLTASTNRTDVTAAVTVLLLDG